MVLHPKDFATACGDAKIGWEVQEGGQTGGRGRTLLSLEAYADYVQRRDYCSISRGLSTSRDVRATPSSEVKMLPLTAESIFCAIEMSFSIGLLDSFGMLGVSRAPSPGGGSILLCGCP